MAKLITTRIPDEFVLELKKISEKENLDTSAVIRRLLAKAIKEWRLQYALDRYSEGEFSFGQTAEFAEVSLWDLPLLLKKHNMPMNYDLEELGEDLKTIGWKK